MYAAQQIQRAEHALNNIEGCKIVASKKKRKTFAAKSMENSSTAELQYALPPTYAAFKAE